MKRIDPDLLPEAFREPTITRGEYNRRIPELPDAALCNHAEVYAVNCAAQCLAQDPDDPAAYLHFFVLPELVARFAGGHAAETPPPNPDSPFRRCIDWDRLVERMAAEVAAQRVLAALDDADLAAAATAAHAAVHCRWNAGDCVYDAVVHHTILPELIRRTLSRGPALGR